MGTLLFLLLHATRQLQSPFDCYWFTLLVSLDAQTALRLWLWTRTR